MYTNIYTDLNQQRKHILWPKYGLFVLQPYISWMEACFDRGVDSVNKQKKTFENRLKKSLHKTEEGTGDRACWDTATRSFYALTSTGVGAHFLSPASWIIACLSKLIFGLLCEEGSFIYVCIYLFMLNLMGVCT